jgi:hypothetical protein
MRDVQSKRHEFIKIYYPTPASWRWQARARCARYTDESHRNKLAMMKAEEEGKSSS